MGSVGVRRKPGQGLQVAVGCYKISWFPHSFYTLSTHLRAILPIVKRPLGGPVSRREESEDLAMVDDYRSSGGCAFGRRGAWPTFRLGRWPRLLESRWHDGRLWRRNDRRLCAFRLDRYVADVGIPAGRAGASGARHRLAGQRRQPTERPSTGCSCQDLPELRAARAGRLAQLPALRHGINWRIE